MILSKKINKICVFVSLERQPNIKIENCIDFEKVKCKIESSCDKSKEISELI